MPTWRRHCPAPLANGGSPSPCRCGHPPPTVASWWARGGREAAPPSTLGAGVGLPIHRPGNHGPTAAPSPSARPPRLHAAVPSPWPCSPGGSRHGPGRPQACGNHGNEAPLGLRPHGNHDNQFPLPLPSSMAPSRALGRVGAAGPRVPWRAQAQAVGGHEASAAARAAASAHGCRHNAPPASDCPFCLPAGRPAQNKMPRQRCPRRHGLAPGPGDRGGAVLQGWHPISPA